jgi:hypothetical protein
MIDSPTGPNAFQPIEGPPEPFHTMPIVPEVMDYGLFFMLLSLGIFISSRYLKWKRQHNQKP